MHGLQDCNKYVMCIERTCTRAKLHLRVCPLPRAVSAKLLFFKAIEARWVIKMAWQQLQRPPASADDLDDFMVPLFPFLATTALQVHNDS